MCHSVPQNKRKQHHVTSENNVRNVSQDLWSKLFFDNNNFMIRWVLEKKNLVHSVMKQSIFNVVLLRVPHTLVEILQKLPGFRIFATLRVNFTTVGFNLFSEMTIIEKISPYIIGSILPNIISRKLFLIKMFT